MDNTGLTDKGASVQGSEYKSRYQEYAMPRRLEPFKPKSEPISRDAAMDTVTTNKLDYVPHPMVRQQAVKPTDNNLQQQGNYDFTSSYNNTFLGTSAERVKPIRQDKQKEQLDKFVGEPSYKADFKEWSLPARHQREVAAWKPPQDRFEGNTTSKKDFTEHSISPREKAVKRFDEWGFPEGRFEGSTGYRDTFKTHELPPRRPRHRQLWTQPAVKFDAQTTKQSDFTGPYQPKRDSFRPDRTALLSDAPFDASTTSKSDYQEKPLTEKFVHSYQPYVKPEGKMDLSTTNQSQFREFPISRQAIEKPSSSHILRGTGPMATESNYNSDFLGHHAARREMLKPRNNYQPPSTRFEGQSTAKDDFVEKQISPRESYRPNWGPVTSDAPFESSTENKASFVEKPVQPRRRREKEVYVAPSVPFQASTTSKESYQGVTAPRTRNFKPNAIPIQSDIKFDGRTTFMSDFQEHQVSPRYRHEHEQYMKPEGAMDMSTSNRDAFRDMGLPQRAAVVKPGSSGIMKKEGQFTGTTSYTGDFTVPDGASRQLVRPRNEYQPSADPFQGTTTQREDFRGAYAPKQASFRPQNRPLQNLNAFEDNVACRQDSQAWRGTGPTAPPPLTV